MWSEFVHMYINNPVLCLLITYIYVYFRRADRQLHCVYFISVLSTAADTGIRADAGSLSDILPLLRDTIKRTLYIMLLG